MLKRGLLFCAVLGVTANAFGGAAIDLRPDVAGPYNAGQVVNFDVFLVDTGNPQGNILFRGVFLDFTDTDSGIVSVNNWRGPDGIFADNPGPPANEEADNPQDEITWVNPFGIGAVFDSLPKTSWVYPLPTANMLFQYVLPDGGEVNIGDVNVTMPNDAGTYNLDVMNDDVADPNFGARLDFGFGGAGDPVTTWRAFTGDITGGTESVTVIPEPATLALLGVGAIAALRRRRAA
jgi:hypothetical protein